MKECKFGECENIVFYDLFDCAESKATDQYKGRVYSKEEADHWVKHGILRTHHEKFLCKKEIDERGSNTAR